MYLQYNNNIIKEEKKNFPHINIIFLLWSSNKIIQKLVILTPIRKGVIIILLLITYMAESIIFMQ
jgi:hypothetical protein